MEEQEDDFDERVRLKAARGRTEDARDVILALGLLDHKVINALSDEDLHDLKLILDDEDPRLKNWAARAFKVGGTHAGMAAIRCYPFFQSCTDDAKHTLSPAMRAVCDVLGEYPQERASEFNLGNIKVSFLLSILSMHNQTEQYASTHEYYRDLEMLRSNLAQIEPAFSFLFMLAGASRGGRVFQSIPEILEAAEKFACVPKEEFPGIREFVQSRGKCDAGLIEAFRDSKAGALHDGVL